MATGSGRLLDQSNPFVIITEYNTKTQGFLVRSVERIVNMNWEEIHPPPKGTGRDHYLTAVTRVEQSLALGRTGKGWFSAPKTRAGKRTVVLPKIAVAALGEHMTRFTPPARDSLLFGTQNGTPLSSGARTTMFARRSSMASPLH